jgi:succinoglycan biosynthesis transport protein ExoP
MDVQRPAYDAGEHQFEVSDASGGGISLAEFQRVLRVRSGVIFGTALVVIALAAALVVLATPLYTATAIVMLDQRKNSVEDAAAAISGLGTDPTTVQNQVQILTSVELANRVTEKLKLDQDPEFSPQAGWTAVFRYLSPATWFPGAISSRAAAARLDIDKAQLAQNFLSRVRVDPIGLSTAMNVSFESRDPQKAQLIANAIANAYVEDQLEAKFDATQKATQWLAARIADLSRKAQAADQAVQSYKAAHNITTTATGTSVVDQQTVDINSQLVLAKTDLAEKEAAYSGLVSLARSGRASGSAAAMASPVISALRAQDSEITRQLADLSSKYLPGHPKILDLQAQKANIDSRIAEEVQRIIDSARNDVSVSSAHVGSLQGSLHQLEGQGATQNQASVGLTALQSSAASARAMYEAFLGRLNQTQGQEGIQTPDARVISAAETPLSPSFPKKGLTLGLAVPAGLALGLMLAFLIERLDTGFRTSQQTEAFLGLPVLSVLPEAKGSAEVAALVVDKPMSSFAEAMRGIQLGLTLSNVDREPKVVLITSSVPSEGKTSVSVGLARMAARSGKKVLLIDGDLRRPSLAKHFSKNSVKGGLIEAITGQVPLDQCFCKDPKSEALGLIIQKPPASPADILSSDAMLQLIKTVSKIFDLVIIDSAPVLPVNDTKIISRMADAIIFVVRWEKTPREAAVNAVRSLAMMHVPIAGAVITRAEERFRYYNYGYQDYRNYNKYYSG